MTNQLILKFPKKKAYFKEDFYVSESNQEAYDFIMSWPKWIKKIVNIYGQSCSGKTHLASLLKNKNIHEYLLENCQDFHNQKLLLLNFYSILLGHIF